ncbi:hypothetical protein BGZ46_009590 [Entomortierella lignicola]|nr:hypothetical protein BGZ46_009590 [Entomortierella lignicola]
MTHHEIHEKNHAEVYRPDVSEEHKATWSHELIGGAAAFEAFKLYEDKRNPNDPHKLAKEALAGIVGTQLDKLFETKGLDFIDRQKAKHHAQQEADKLYAEKYGQDV